MYLVKKELNICALSTLSSLLHIPIDNQGTHPVKDFLLCYRFYKVLRQVRPVVYLGYTVKPNVYGSLAAHLLHIPVINNIAGLGAAFINQTWLTVVVRALYRLALARSAKVFFQNKDDKQLFILEGLVKEQKTGLLPGSGIDLNKFTPVPIVAGAVVQLDPSKSSVTVPFPVNGGPAGESLKPPKAKAAV